MANAANWRDSGWAQSVKGLVECPNCYGDGDVEDEHGDWWPCQWCAGDGLVKDEHDDADA